MKIIWKILIKFSWINTSLQDLKFKAELSHILFIFSTYFTLPHYESTVQLHPSMSQRCEAERSFCCIKLYH